MEIRSWHAKIARVLPFGILGFALVWYAVLVIRFHSFGAIGNDPATYVQMAHDLAQRGTVLHDFPLFAQFSSSGLPWYTFIAPGYHFLPDGNVFAPNYAFGFPLLLALTMRALGENALYWTTPVLGGLSLLATFGLSRDLLFELPSNQKNWIGALAVLLLATTPKQMELAFVPMSDVPTQLFCVLALWCALRVTKRETIEWKKPIEWNSTAEKSKSKNKEKNRVKAVSFAALGGISLGMAYLIRHSALVMLVPLALVIAQWNISRREKVFLILFSLVVFALTISPDVVYRTTVLGSPFAVESAEATQLALADAPHQFLQTLGALFSVTGFGPLVLVAPFGWWILKRKNPFAAAILLAWSLGFILFHAPLRLTDVFENNLRYLLPAYPAIAISISFGIVWLVTATWQRFSDKKSWLAARNFAYYGGAGLVVIGLGIALRTTVNPERFIERAYGWMRETSRQELDALNQQLPSNAVIGVSAQMAGATILYGQRDVFLPGNFSDPLQQFPQFLKTMQEQNRPVYLIGDWNCPALATADEKLPQWLGQYNFLQTGMPISDLPFQCNQIVYQLKGE